MPDDGDSRDEQKAGAQTSSSGKLDTEEEKRGSIASDCSSRDTNVVIVELETNEVYVFISLSMWNNTQVVRIDPTTGSLCYTGKLGYDIFNSEEEAVNYVTDGSRISCKGTTYAKAILGYSAAGGIGLLLVATRLNATIPNLPGGGCVYTVIESRWIKIQLQNPQPQRKEEIKNIQELCELDIDGKHFFCETRDITRPFPSRMTSQSPDDEFVWNGWLSKPFKLIGLPKHCVTLLQGVAECRNFTGSTQQGGTVALIARRSRLHPGTRYLARGLNACSSTGNEVECEQLVWVPQKTGEIVPFGSYIWRRGTIPIWWGAELKFATDAEIYVSSRDPYIGSRQYYERLSRRYSAHTSEMKIINNPKTSLVPIVCINLLRKGEGKAENILVEHFEESLNYIRSTGKLSNTRIQLINYDWHTNIKLKGEQQTIEELWKHLKGHAMNIGFCEGNYYPSHCLKECNGLVVCNNDIKGEFWVKSLQNGVLRFNCADSLDRTNAASYFGCLQVFVEQCRRLGISIDRDPTDYFPSTSEYTELHNHSGNTDISPPDGDGLSDATTGKTCNSNNSTCLSEMPWKKFDMTFDQFKSSILSTPISQLADIFLMAGDIHATLYTGSKAMHSHILHIFGGDGGKPSTFSVAQNVKITLQRKYQNAVVDSSRQKQIEMFLGMRLFKHLPSIPVHPMNVLSRPPGCLLKPISSMHMIGNDGSALLSFKQKDLIWVFPPGSDVVELFIYLREPCHVCQLLLTVAHGSDDSSYPGILDIRTGCNLDELKLVVEGLCVPHCSNGTNLMIPLIGRINPEDMVVAGNRARLHTQESSYIPLLYDFEELEGELNFLTRIVVLTFYPSFPGRTVTLGEIEVLGVSLPWMGICTGNVTTKFMNLQRKPRESDASERSALSTAQSSVVSNDISILNGNAVSQPAVSSVEESSPPESRGPTDLFDSSVAHYLFSADSNPPLYQKSHDCKNTQRYINLYKVISDSQKGQSFEFFQALNLEIERLRLNLSAAERDTALLAINIDPATIDPNCLLEVSDMTKLCSYAENLAILGHTAFENQINASIGLEKIDNNVQNFWNINEIGETCLGSPCEVHAETLPNSKDSSVVYSTTNTPLPLCSNCQKKVCKVCCIGKGGCLLIGKLSKDKSYDDLYSQAGSDLGKKCQGSPDGNLILQDDVLCKLCCNKFILHALYVDYIRVLSSLQRRARAVCASQEALKQVFGNNIDTTSNSQKGFQIYNRELKEALNGESLAEFPYASLLYTVETAAESEPALSLLAPLGIGGEDSFWSAPASVSTVEFSIVLGSLSDVSGVALIVSSCGYSTSDCPVVQIWTGNRLHPEERSFIGKWDVQSLISSNPQFYGPGKPDGDITFCRHVKFLFSNPVRCRIIWISLSLPQLGSHPVNLEKECSLLPTDDSSVSEPNRDVPFDQTIRNDPCIHAKKLIVFGNTVRKQIDHNVSLEVTDMSALKNFLGSPPKLVRFQIPFEAEKLTDNNILLEQYLSPTVPKLAGFRLDAFSIVKSQIPHSPSLQVDIPDSSLTWLEDRHIKPAVLYIQVSAFQEPGTSFLVGEYLLPEVRANTTLYFDFPRSIQARRVTFRLHGDVTAFTDDFATPGCRTLPLASGLSLSNRIKLYCYAEPQERSQLGNLSLI